MLEDVMVCFVFIFSADYSQQLFQAFWFLPLADPLCEADLGLHQHLCVCTEVPAPLCMCVHMCVHGWLSSLWWAFAEQARALQLPRGHHCPRSPQPSGHRCSPFDTMLLTHTPHSPRYVGGQAGCPVACHFRTPLAAWCLHVTLKGEAIASTVLILPPCIMEQK